jgi:hypothetical protein
VQQLTESTYIAAVCSFEPETLLITEINPHQLLPGASTDAPEVEVIVAGEDDDEADPLRVGDAGPEDDLAAGVVDSEYEPEGHVVQVRTVEQNITALEGTLANALKASELAKAAVRRSGGGSGGSGSGGSADQEAVVVDPAASALQKLDALTLPEVQEEQAPGIVHARKLQDAFVPLPQDVQG